MMNERIIPFSSRFIAIQELAARLTVDRSQFRRYALSQGFEWSRMRTDETRGQLTLCLSPEEAEQLKKRRREQGYRV